MSVVPYVTELSESDDDWISFNTSRHDQNVNSEPTSVPEVPEKCSLFSQ